jgi:hypothetical protein
MNDPKDAYIQQELKNWAAHQRPPSKTRSQLLSKASDEIARIEQLDALKIMDESLASPDAHLNPDDRSRELARPRWVFMYMTMAPLSLAAY